MKIEISRDDVLKLLGYKGLPKKVLLDAIDHMLEAAEETIAPSMVFKEIKEESPIPVFYEGAALRYVGIVTIGSKLEDRVVELFESGQPTEAYILDVIGSLAASKAGNLFWESLRHDAASKGFPRGVRRAPGCQGVDMETQGWLFEQLRGQNIHVNISSTYMMIPRKSLSFVARFGGRMKRTFSCAGCRQFAECSMKG